MKRIVLPYVPPARIEIRQNFGVSHDRPSRRGRAVAAYAYEGPVRHGA